MIFIAGALGEGVWLALAGRNMDKGVGLAMLVNITF